MNQKRVAIYTRISSSSENEDDEEYSRSPQRQENACRALCKSRKWKVTHCYSDRNKSAFKNHYRPDYEQMLHDMAEGEFDVLLVWKFDRLHRGTMASFMPLYDLLRKTGTDFVSVTEPFLDTTGEFAELLWWLIGWCGKRESEAIAARQRLNHDDKRKAGIVHGSGRRLFGFSKDGLTLDPVEAPIARQMVTWFLAGDSHTTIARKLNADGHVTTQSNPWTPITVRHWLHRPRLAGYRQSGGKLYHVTGDKLIDDETWRDLKRGLSQASKPLHRSYWWSGLFTCGECGGTMMAGGSDANGRQRIRCRKGEPSPDNCGSITVLQSEAVALVEDEVVGLLLKQRAAPRARTDIPQIEQELCKVRGELDRLTLSFVKGRISEGVYDEQYDDVRNRIDGLEDALARARERDAVVMVRVGEFTTLPVHEQRRIARRLIKHVIVKPVLVRGRNVFDADRIDIVPA